MEKSETVSVVVNIDRTERSAQDAVMELERAGLSECNVLYNLNIVIGRAALTGAIQETLDGIKAVRGVKEATADFSTGEDWIV